MNILKFSAYQEYTRSKSSQHWTFHEFSMQFTQFSPVHTVLTIPSIEVKSSLTEGNHRPTVALAGSCFVEAAKKHCGGRSYGPLPEGWVTSKHNGTLFYYHAATCTSTYEHPTPVMGSTWSACLPRAMKQLKTRDQRVLAAAKTFAGRLLSVEEIRS